MSDHGNREHFMTVRLMHIFEFGCCNAKLDYQHVNLADFKFVCRVFRARVTRDFCSHINTTRNNSTNSNMILGNGDGPR